MDIATEKAALARARQIFEENDLQFPVDILTYGTYSQYEVAGQHIDTEASFLQSQQVMNLPDVAYEECQALLEFLIADYEEGSTDQNQLQMDKDGELITEHFLL